MSLRPFVALLLVASSTAAGCVDILGVPRSDCSFAGRPCDRDGDGWIVEDVDVQGDAALHVSSGDHVLLRNVHVQNPQNVRFEVECSCVVRGENFVVDGDGSTDVSIRGAFDEITSDVAVDGVVLRDVARLVVWQIGGNVRLSNLSLECHPGADIQLDAEAETKSFELVDVRAEGCNRIVVGQQGEGPPVSLSLLRTHYNGTGMDGGDGITTAGDSRINVTLVDSSIRNVRYGIGIGEGTSMTVRNSTISHSDTAIGMGGGAAVHLDGAIIADNLYGIRAWDRSRVEATHSHFLRNGAKLSIARECGGAITGGATGFVHASIFEGNARTIDNYAGIPASGQTLLFDATGNYWGAATGPTPSDQCLATAPLGDPVGSGVTTVPFLTAPPS